MRGKALRHLFLILIIFVLFPGFVHGAWELSPASTTLGGGTWGSILHMTASIDGDNVTFTVKKQSSTFSSNVDVYLKVGTYETNGENWAVGVIEPGSSEWSHTHDLSSYSYPKSFYFRIISNANGYAWVGPITVSNNDFIPAEERAVLIALYNSTGGDNWTGSSGWKTPPLHTDGFASPGTEEGWYGITVSAEQVVRIDLSSNQLSGGIPQELGNLGYLEYLYLFDNQLTGTVPTQLGNLRSLKLVSLNDNQLTGNIPTELERLSNLVSIHLGANQLSGSIPAELGNISRLVYLNLEDNMLTGSIPVELGNLSNLESLDLQPNSLTGSIPEELGNLSNLQYLNLGDNQLTGSIPQALGKISSLEHLYLGGNQLSGNIPKELGDLGNLVGLSLAANQLNGSIPPGLGNLSNLSHLQLANNNLSGIIPTEFGNPAHLTYLNVSNNQLSGNTPSELGNLSNLEHLYLNNNHLSGPLPGNLKNLTKVSFPWIDIGFNCLYAIDSELKTWLNSVDPDWENNQNECYATLTVRSSPDIGVPITVTPIDNYGQGDGYAEFFRTFDLDTIITLAAPAVYNGMSFSKWIIDNSEYSDSTVQVAMDKDYTAQAIYNSDNFTLTVQSVPASGVGIAVAPIDNNGYENGDTNFTRTYGSDTQVSLTAPLLVGDNDFIKWAVDGIDFTKRTIQVIMDNNRTAVVYYSQPPTISVDRSRLNFGYIIGGNNLPAERFAISNTGGGTLNWSACTEMHRVSLNPESGENSGEVEVTINPVGLTSDKFRGVIYISDSLASNSPVEVEINLWVKTQAESSPPFGEFSTPLDGSNVSSSVPVTGWALGDTGIESVKVYREEGKSLVYIGDAGFVEGARPDIETGYSGYPMNHKAGWGYMMLTHFLPNGGNGTFKIHAIATDKEGRTNTLGIKTITVDNANAVKPFGAIDTPAQGGTASGSNYRNHGWVLTPPPNKIPEDGSTINVYVDGVSLGHPAYNIYREDIAGYFPGYSNSSGAHVYFDLDTTVYANGVHTIFWTAEDNAGNVDGIGSRYFTIQNSQSAGRSEGGGRLLTLSDIPVDYSRPIAIKRGYRKDAEPQKICADDSGIIHVNVKELERLEIQLSRDIVEIYGYMVAGSQLKPLPIGSTLDIKNAVFYWQPGPGFFGEYRLIFIEKKISGDISKKEISVNIFPKLKDKKK